MRHHAERVELRPAGTGSGGCPGRCRWPRRRRRSAPRRSSRAARARRAPTAVPGSRSGRSGGRRPGRPQRLAAGRSRSSRTRPRWPAPRPAATVSCTRRGQVGEVAVRAAALAFGVDRLGQRRPIVRTSASPSRTARPPVLRAVAATGSASARAGVDVRAAHDAPRAGGRRPPATAASRSPSAGRAAAPRRTPPGGSSLNHDDVVDQRREAASRGSRGSRSWRTPAASRRSRRPASPVMPLRGHAVVEPARAAAPSARWSAWSPSPGAAGRPRPAEKPATSTASCISCSWNSGTPSVFSSACSSSGWS